MHRTTNFNCGTGEPAVSLVQDASTGLAAMIGGVCGLARAAFTLPGVVVTDDPPPPPEASHCLTVDKANYFIDADPGNADVLLMKDGRGQPVVRFSDRDADCGLRNLDVIGGMIDKP